MPLPPKLPKQNKAAPKRPWNLPMGTYFLFTSLLGWWKTHCTGQRLKNCMQITARSLLSRDLGQHRTPLSIDAASERPASTLHRVLWGEEKEGTSTCSLSYKAPRPHTHWHRAFKFPCKGRLSVFCLFLFCLLCISPYSFFKASQMSYLSAC